jgi:predicted transcriptional regulator
MYSIEVVSIAIKLYSEGLSKRQIGIKLNVSRQIVAIWIKNINSDLMYLTNRFNKYLKNINIIKENEFNNKHINIMTHINELIYNNPFYSRHNIVCKIFERFNVKINKSVVTEPAGFLRFIFINLKKFL